MWSISGHVSVLLSVVGSFSIRLTVLELHTWQSVLFSCSYYTVLVVLGSCVPRTILVCRKSDSYGLIASSFPFRLPFASVLGVCKRLVLRFESYRTGVFCVFCLSSCLRISGCSCPAQWFQGPFEVSVTLL